MAAPKSLQNLCKLAIKMSDALHEFDFTGWAPEESVVMQLRMADEGYLNSAELSALQNELPPGLSVDAAISGLQAMDEAKSNEKQDISTGQEIMLQLRMAAQGFIDDDELEVISSSLPNGWTVESALAAVANTTCEDEFNSLSAALGLRQEPEQTEGDGASSTAQSDPALASQAAVATQEAETASSAQHSWEPSESELSMLLMANGGYLDDAEVEQLESTLPDGWDVTRALKHVSDMSSERDSTSQQSHQNCDSDPVQSERIDQTSAERKAANELLVTLKMAAAGYSDESELEPMLYLLPQGWDLARALRAFEESDAGAIQQLRAAMGVEVVQIPTERREEPKPAASRRSSLFGFFGMRQEAAVVDTTLPSSPTQAEADSDGPTAFAGAAAADSVQPEGQKPKRGSLRSALSFFSSRAPKNMSRAPRQVVVTGRRAARGTARTQPE